MPLADNAPLIDHLVGAAEHGRGHGVAPHETAAKRNIFAASLAIDVDGVGPKII